MPADEQPHEPGRPAPRIGEGIVSLVDYIDQIERAAFRRSLELRGAYFLAVYPSRFGDDVGSAGAAARPAAVARTPL